MNAHDVSRHAHAVVRSALCLTIAGSLAACADSPAGLPGSTGEANIRYVNGVYQEVYVGPVTTTVSHFSGITSIAQSRSVTYEPISIDVLLDSSATAPAVMALPPASVSSGPVGQAPANLPSGYYSTSPGIHSFVARKSGLTPGGFSFFTTTSSGVTQQYLPKQYLPGGTYYTMGFAGIVPMVKTDGSETITPPTNFVFNLPWDDPFPPPTMIIDGQNSKMASFQVYNLATWATSTTGVGSMRVYMVPGTTPTTDTSGKIIEVPSPNDLLTFRKYTNVRPGTYYLSIWSSEQNSRRLTGAVVTLKPGEIRTFFVVNDMLSYSTTSTTYTQTWDEDGSLYQKYTQVNPSTPPTYKLIDVTDNQY